MDIKSFAEKNFVTMYSRYLYSNFSPSDNSTNFIVTFLVSYSVKILFLERVEKRLEELSNFC